MKKNNAKNSFYDKELTRFENTNDTESSISEELSDGGERNWMAEEQLQQLLNEEG